MSRRFFTLPAGTKPPVQQQAKLKVVKKGATKEKEDVDESTAENDKEVQEPLRALKLEDEEGDTVMTGTPEVEEEEVKPRKTKKKGGKKLATKTDETGGCRLFLPFFPQH